MAGAIPVSETRFTLVVAVRHEGSSVMKVVIVTAFPDDPSRISSGPAGVGVTLSGALASIPGLDLELVVPGSSLPEETIREVAGLRVHYLPRKGPIHPAVGYLWTSPRQIARKLAEIDHDLVHVQNWASFLPRSREPALLTIHGILERDILYRGRFRWLRSQVMRQVEMRARGRAAYVIVVSPYVRRCLGSQIHGRAWDIDNPVGDRFFEVERRPVRSRILFAGRMTPLKNVLGLIDAFALHAADDPQAELRLAGGDGGTGYSAECARLAATLGVTGRVKFLGLTGAEQMTHEYSRASCLALCSFQENAPVVIGEAMAAGVPVVASMVGGIPSMVEDGQTGRLVDPRDHLGIARAIADVLAPGRGEMMSSRAREIAGERFRPAVVARRTFDVYREILEESGARGTGAR